MHKLEHYQEASNGMPGRIKHPYTLVEILECEKTVHKIQKAARMFGWKREPWWQEPNEEETGGFEAVSEYEDAELVGTNAEEGRHLEHANESAGEEPSGKHVEEEDLASS